MKLEEKKSESDAYDEKSRASKNELEDLLSGLENVKFIGDDLVASDVALDKKVSLILVLFTFMIDANSKFLKVSFDWCWQTL